MEGTSYQGYEVEKHRALMAAKMYVEIAVSCVVFQILLLLLFVPANVPALYRELFWKWPAAKTCTLLHLNRELRLHAPGRLLLWPHDGRGNVTVDAQTLTETVSYQRIFTAADAHWGRAGFLSFLAWLLWPASLLFFRKATAAIKNNEHIRGSQLVTEKEIQRESDGTGILPVGGKIRISESISRRHILIAGQTGSGKSTVLIQHLEAIQQAKRRAIVNDFKGELVERFYRPGRDHILNPLDARGLGWTLFNELKSRPDLAAITASLIPPAKGEDRFWSAAAQDVLRGVMAYCYECDERTNAQLWKAVTAEVQDLRDMCRATPSGQAGFTYIQDASSKQAVGVIAVLMSYISWLEFAPDGPFCLREWANDAKDNTVFITSSEEASNIMRPYLSLFADLASKRFLTLPENLGAERSIYLVLDEMGNMQRLPSVKRLLTAGRSKGIIVEIGIPDFTSIESIYGREDAHTIVNSCGSKLVMNLGDPDAARFFSELAAEEEYWESGTYYNISPHENRGGETHNRQIKTRKVIMPAQFLRLPVGQGYFMLPGGNPALITIPWTAANRRPARNAAFILRPGLSLEEIEAKGYEVTVLAEEVKEGPVPEALRKQVTENLIRRGGAIETMPDSRQINPDVEAAFAEPSPADTGPEITEE